MAFHLGPTPSLLGRVLVTLDIEGFVTHNE